jgi:hypothetical protein
VIAISSGDPESSYDSIRACSQRAKAAELKMEREMGFEPTATGLGTVVHLQIQNSYAPMATIPIICTNGVG